MRSEHPLAVAYAAHQLGRGFSSATIRRRAVTLRSFDAFIDPADLRDATSGLVEEFAHRYRCVATRHAYLTDLRAFFRWAHRRGLVDHDPTLAVDPIRLPPALPRPVDASLVGWLIDTAPDREVAVAVALAAYAGLRLADIANLDRADIMLGTTPPVLVVRHGKGGKDRAVPIHPTLAPLLAGLPAGPLIGVRPGTLGHKVARHMRAHGVDATLHKLRHTFGTEAARATNGNLLIVADLMGHSSTLTTQGYVKLVGVSTSAAVGMMYPDAA